MKIYLMTNGGRKMSTSIEVHKKSVKELLSEGKDHPFVIPEYQRPYAWSDEEIQTLFDDLWEFTTNGAGGSENNGTYFLGTVVSYENENKEQEIIDGQQRITSLFLLLRAIYTMLSNSDTKTKEAENFIKQIEPAIWRTNKLTGEVDYTSILLTSRVMNNEGNEVLRILLETGKADKKAVDNYSLNYMKFQDLLADVSQENPLMIYEFIYVILNQAILLPITADTQDTALTIFSTLNDRGLQLSDADIFKAKIYNHLSADEKPTFIDAWKELDEKATSAGESIQQLFYYYMFYLRALDKDNKTTTPGVRKYYSANKFEKLFANNLMENLSLILIVWRVVNKHESFEEETWTSNMAILQALDTLSSYPNEFWKYPVIIFYLAHRSEKGFEQNFELFLKKLLLELLTKYLVTPTINAVKSDILKLNVEIIASAHPKFEFKEIDEAQLEGKIRVPHRNAVRMLLKIHAYDKQGFLLPDRWEIEHILPQKWQAAYFMTESDEMIKERIEHIGNKLPFEKKLNIIAGNGYFDKKKSEYAQSTIAVTKAMAETESHDWKLEQISERDIRVSDAIISILNRWDAEYKRTPVAIVSEQPTPDQLAFLQEAKARGRI